MRVLVVGGGIIGTTAAVRLKIRYPEAEVNCEAQAKGRQGMVSKRSIKATERP